MRGRTAGNDGFTLVEVLVAIVVLGILGGIVVLGLGPARSDATSAACRADVAGVNVAASAYHAVTGEYPSGMAQLTAGQYLKAAPGSGTFTFDISTRTATRTPACALPEVTVSPPVPSASTSPVTSPATSPTTSPTTSPGPAAACSSQASLDNSWPQGHQAAVTVTNTGTSTLSPWTATWTVPASVKLVNGWNATITQAGKVMTAQAPSWSQSLAPGASWSVGYIADGPWASGPSRVTLNGVSCG
jgi:prepilin-type N-terminal cleavage/methylation domain-containing protein